MFLKTAFHKGTRLFQLKVTKSLTKIETNKTLSICFSAESGNSLPITHNGRGHFLNDNLPKKILLKVLYSFSTNFWVKRNQYNMLQTLNFKLELLSSRYSILFSLAVFDQK